jgi:hypothetical protein
MYSIDYWTHDLELRDIISVNIEPTNLAVRKAGFPVENTGVNEQNITINLSCHICVTSL